MIPFDEIDDRLVAIGKDRAWLASATQYSPSYIASILARNSLRRNDRIHQLLSHVIEAEEAIIGFSNNASERLVRTHQWLREIAPESYSLYCRAADNERLTLEAWILRAAGEKAMKFVLEKNG